MYKRVKTVPKTQEVLNNITIGEKYTSNLEIVKGEPFKNYVPIPFSLWRKR